VRVCRQKKGGVELGGEKRACTVCGVEKGKGHLPEGLSLFFPVNTIEGDRA